MKYAKPSTIETPIQAALNSARAQKAATFKRVQEINGKIKAAGVFAGNLRLELIKAKSKHGDAVWLEKACLRAIEKRANELGLTTIRAKRTVAV